MSTGYESDKFLKIIWKIRRLIRFSTKDKTRKLNSSGFSLMMKMLKFSKERKAYGNRPQNRQFMMKKFVNDAVLYYRCWKWERPKHPQIVPMSTKKLMKAIYNWRFDENYGRKLCSDFLGGHLKFKNQELTSLHLGVSTVHIPS